MGKVFPARIISTFFGVGYLPTWQNHWASFLALVIFYILLYLMHGSYFLLNGMQGATLVIALFFLKASVAILIIQIVAIFIFHINDPSANSNENIVIQAVLAQLLIVALTMPATTAIFYNITDFYDQICKKIFVCPRWLNSFMYFIIFFIIPYVFLNIVELIKPWPIVSIQLSYNNAISITVEGIIYAFYTIIFMYLVAFIFFNLTLQEVATFNQYFMSNIKASNHHLHNM